MMSTDAVTYPGFKERYLEEELGEHFSLEDDERAFVGRFFEPQNKLGCAVLLKTTLFLGYVPESKKSIPRQVVEFIAGEIKVEPGKFRHYRWKGRTWKHHLARIRNYTGLHSFKPLEDQARLVDWLAERAMLTPTRKELTTAAIEWCRTNVVELPTKDELKKHVGTAFDQFRTQLHERVSAELGPTVCDENKKFLDPPGGEASRLEWLKSPAGKMGIKTILAELEKLRVLRCFPVETTVTRLTPRVYRMLLARVRAENAFELRRHPLKIGATLFAVLVHARGMEVTDNIVRLFLELVGRIDTKTDKTLGKDLLKQIEVVYGKTHMLYKIAERAVADPDGSVREVIFPVVPEQTLQRLADESKQQKTRYPDKRAEVKSVKYSRSYRRMVGPVLQLLTFRANNHAIKPLLLGVDIVKRFLELPDRLLS